MAQGFRDNEHGTDDWTSSVSRDQVMYDNWVYLKDPVKERWDRLTDMRLDAIDGHREHLIDHIQVVYGIHREQAEAEVNDFMDDYHDYFRFFSDRAPSTPLAPRAGR